MKSQDQISLENAYTLINESKKKDRTGDGKTNFDDIKVARMVASGMSEEEAVAKVTGKKKNSDTKKKENEKKDKKENSLEEAYQRILESKYINKKFARRYNKVTAALLKAEPGSEEYQKLKSEREDLVGILKDHNKSVADLETLLAKKEVENPLPDTDFSPNIDQQYGDNSYSDTADLDSNVIKADFSATPQIPEINSQPEVAVAQ